MEVEVRFGVFDRKGRFIPGVSKKEFDAILHVFRNWTKTVRNDTVESFGTIRKITADDGDVIYQKKEKLDTKNFPLRGYRLCVSRETPVSPTQGRGYIRRRRRITLTKDAVQIDCTVVNGVYEVEVEVGPNNEDCGAVDTIINIRRYKDLVGYWKFAGPLPQSLTSDAFYRRTLSKKPYAVTEKADGERFLLFENHLISRKMDVIPFSHIGYGTMVDGELVGDTFYAFDILFMDGVDVRSKNLRERLKLLKTLGIPVKKFYFYDIYKASGHIWDNRNNFPYDLDGLIFTPVDEPYYNKNIYKWKDRHTIDFYYENERLYVGGTMKNGEYGHVPLKESKIPPNVRAIGAPGVGEYEFRDGVFTLVKERPDKEFANSVRATNQSWEAIQYPLRIEEIVRGPGVLREFHNEVKAQLINRYTRNARVLDIGTGRGGDINKYIRAGVREVVGFDIVDVEYNHPDYMKFYKMSNPVYRVRDYVEGRFDIININFAIHYFFKDREMFESLLRNILDTLRPGGLLMATVLDGRLIHEMPGDIDTETVSITKRYTDTELRLLGQRVDVMVKGTKYFTEPVPEYLFNFEKFMEVMESLGFELVEAKNFGHMSCYSKEQLSASEQDYSFKNMYFIIRRNVASVGE